MLISILPISFNYKNNHTLISVPPVLNYQLFTNTLSKIYPLKSKSDSNKTDFLLKGISSILHSSLLRLFNNLIITLNYKLYLKEY